MVVVVDTAPLTSAEPPPAERQRCGHGGRRASSALPAPERWVTESRHVVLAGRVEFLGTDHPRRPELSRRVRMQLHMHGRPTSAFIGSEPDSRPMVDNPRHQESAGQEGFPPRRPLLCLRISTGFSTGPTGRGWHGSVLSGTGRQRWAAVAAARLGPARRRWVRQRRWSAGQQRRSC
jgi:hypothetical protein